MNKDNENYNYKIAVIGDNILCTGFKLLGDKKTYSIDEKVEDILKNLINDPDIGIIIINQKIIENIKSNKTLDLINKTIKPLIIEVPGYNEEDMHQDTLRKIILRAIGININIKL